MKEAVWREMVRLERENTMLKAIIEEIGEPIPDTSKNLKVV